MPGLRRRVTRAEIFGSALAGLLVVAGCGGSTTTPAADSVVVSTTVIADWVSEVGGDSVAVSTLVPAGSDAHTLQLSPGKVRSIADASLIVLNGAGLEAGFERAVEENASAVVLDLSAAIGLEGRGEDAERLDPHFWLDASLAAEAIQAIGEALQELLPERAASIGERLERYLGEVGEADAEIAASLRGLNEERRGLVTLHDAYGYFARHYGLEIVGFVVEGPEEEPSAEDIATLVAEIRRRGIPRVYAEEQFTARIIEQIAAETGAEIRRLVSLPNETFPTYLAVLRANADAIRR